MKILGILHDFIKKNSLGRGTLTGPRGRLEKSLFPVDIV